MVKMKVLRLASRFGVVGIAATIIYLMVANILIHLGIVEVGLASVIAYLAGMGVSYVGQSRWTFRGTAGEGRLARFSLVSALGLSISYSAPYAAVWFGLPAAMGTAVPILAVPLLSFFAMNFWVFATRRARGEPRSYRSVTRAVDDKEHRSPR